MAHNTPQALVPSAQMSTPHMQPPPHGQPPLPLAAILALPCAATLHQRANQTRAQSLGAIRSVQSSQAAAPTTDRQLLARLIQSAIPNAWARWGGSRQATANPRLSMAQADAAIVTWDSKYHYDILRPETALRNANWQPLIPSPAFPAYVSGHSMFSGASAQMLARVLGTDRVAFSGSSPDPQLWPNQLRGVRRSWTSLSQAAAENGASREVGGVHWESDNTEGLRVGAQIANAVFNRAFVRRA